MGIYRRVVVSARYQIPQSLDPVPAITSALASVVRDQPLLCVGILDEDTSVATFSHIPEINLRHHLEWRHSDANSVDVYDAEVARTQAWLHDQLFEDIENRAPWRVLCLRPRQESVAKDVAPDGFIDVFFAFHHGITDGTGGRVFHQQLLAALQSQKDSALEDHSTSADYVLSFPDAPRLPESQEEVVPFRNSYVFLLRAIWTMIAPAFLKPRKIPIWGGVDIDFSLPYVTRVRPIRIAEDAVKSLLAASRQQDCTLTTALHGVVLSSLAKRLSEKEAQSFACATPISLRPWIKSPPADPELKDKLRTLVTSHPTNFSPSDLKTLRAPGADVDAIIWQTGQRIKAELKKRIATLPNDDTAGLLPYVSDFVAFYREKDGKTRDGSWEISNVGVVTAPTKTDNTNAVSGWKHLDAMFTNGAMVTGAAIGVNVISVIGGSLTIALSWQENAVAGDLVEGLAGDLIDFTERVHNAPSSAK